VQGRSGYAHRNVGRQVKLEHALQLINDVVAAAAAPVSVFVADERGELVAAATMDGAAPDTGLNARRKAYTVARSHALSTRDLSQMVRENPAELASFDPFYCFFFGGIAVLDGTRRIGAIGAIGVSGLWPIHSTGAAVVPVGPRAGAHYPGSTGGLQARFRTDSDCVEPPSTRGYPPSLERPPAGRPWRASDQHYSG